MVHSGCNNHDPGEEGRDAVTVDGGGGGVMNKECLAGLANNQKQIDGRLTCSSIFDQPSSF